MMRGLIVVILAVILILGESAKIRKLDTTNLEAFSKDNSYWLIQIAESKCKDCSSQEGALQAAADQLDGAVKVGKVQASLIPNLKITSNPTYIFTHSSTPEKSQKFSNPSPTQENLVQFVLDSLQVAVKQKKASSSSGSSSGSSSKSSSSKSSSSGSSSKSKSSSSSSSSSQSSSSSSTVIELTDANFDDKVLKSKDAWLVEFFSPGCGHCKNLEPEYNKLPKMIGKRVHIAKVDGTQHRQLMSKYQIKGFPTIYLFDTGDKTNPIPYEGERTAEGIVSWLKTQQINEEKKELMELSQSVYDAECNRNIICLLFILEKPSDKGKLSYLKEIIQEQTQRPVKFLYSGRLPRLQAQLMIEDRSCPKMIGLWDSINSYKIFNGEHSHEGISEFLKTLMDRKKWIKLSSPIAKTLFSSSSGEQL